MTIIVAIAYGLLFVLDGILRAAEVFFPLRSASPKIVPAPKDRPSVSQLILRNKLAIQRAELILNNQWCFRCQGQCKCGMWSKIFV